MATASTGRTPSGPASSGSGPSLLTGQPGPRDESILPASPNDQATVEDTLGFTPYAKALAAFLTHPSTKAPLTMSIEGKWGSGKSSFIRQLEGHIKDAEQERKTSPRSLMVRFNPWRHDKEQALWAAFALEFLRQVREQRCFAPRWLCSIRLFFLRFSWKSGWVDLICVIASWLCLLSVAAAVILLAIFRGTDYISTVVEFLTQHPVPESHVTPLATVLDWVFGVSGVGGCAALVVYLLALVKRRVGSPLEADLQKHLTSPQYQGSVSFVEKFHQDFPNIMDAYAGERRVYVFVDDLDRCQVPKAAELMQAINLMISADPRLVFVIGMDWETVAAGIAVKNADLVRYLRRPAVRKEKDEELEPGRELKQEDSALEFGREFVEKFIQLRFALPRPRSDDLKRLLESLSAPQASPKNPGFWQPFWTLLKVPFTGDRSVDSGPLAQERGQRGDAAADTSREEPYQFGTSGDSDTIQTVTLALAGAFKNNPRRVKQFLGLYRLRTFIAAETGQFANLEDLPTTETLTLEQLGKFTAIELLWPSLLLEAEEDGGLLNRLEEQALGLREVESGWMSIPGVSEFFQIGCEKETPSRGKWSLASLDAVRLLRVSPYFAPFDRRVPPISGQAAISHTPSDAFADFSIDLNPAPPWSYGYSQTLGGQFKLHAQKQIDVCPGVDAWLSPEIQHISVMHNRNEREVQGTTATYKIPSDMLVMHPGEGGFYDVVRWTCPRSGQYSIRGLFAGLDIRTEVADIDVYVAVNSKPVPVRFDTLHGVGTKTPIDLNRIRLNKDDTLDFVVGAGAGPHGSFWSGSTGLKATITQTGS